jgi:hypothetical protein
MPGNDQALTDRRLERIERRLQSIPSRWAGAPTPPLIPILRILGGNELDTLITYGIKKVTSTLSITALGIDPGYQASFGAPTISAGAITAVPTPTGKNAGSVYTDGTHALTVVGNGTGANITATVSGGKVTGTTVVSGGSGYTSATVTMARPNGTPAGLPFANGIGYGEWTTDGVNWQRVIVVHDARSPIWYALVAGDTCIAPTAAGASARTVNGDSAPAPVVPAIWF